MAIDVFSLVTRFRTEGFSGVVGDLKGIEAQAIKTGAALNQGTIQLDRASSAALNGRKGFRDLTPAYAHQDEVLKKLNATTATQATAMTGLGATLKTLGITFGAFEIGRFLKSTIESAGALHELSQRTGASVRMLSILQFAGSQAGVSSEQIAQGFRGFAMALGNLRDGVPKTVEAFARLGLSAASFKGLSVDKAFELVAVRIGGMKDQMEQAEAAQRIFGRGGAAMLPLLEDLANKGFKKVGDEAARAGAIIEEKFANKADSFTDSITRLTAALRGLAREALEPILPHLTRFVELLSIAVRIGPGETLLGFGGFARNPLLAGNDALNNRADWDPGAAILPGMGASERLSSRQRNRFGPGIVLATDDDVAEAADEQARRVKEYQRMVLDRAGMDDPMKAAGDLGSPFGPMGPMGVRNDDFSHLIRPGVGNRGGADVAEVMARDARQKALGLKLQFATLGQNLGMTLAEGFSAALAAGMRGKNPFKAFGNVVLQGLGSIFQQMGASMIAAGLALIKLLPFMNNPITGGPALLAAGIILTGVGAALGSIATGSGGGGGGGTGGFERDRATHVTLTADGAGGIKPPTNQATVIKVLGKDSPEGQRIFAEYGHRASRRNLS